MADGSGDGSPLQNMSALRHQVDFIRGGGGGGDSGGSNRGQQQQQQPRIPLNSAATTHHAPGPLNSSSSSPSSSSSSSSLSVPVPPLSLSSSSSSSSTSSFSLSSSSSSSSSLSLHHNHHPHQAVNAAATTTNNMRPAAGAAGCNMMSNLNNASSTNTKQNNMNREGQSQMQLTTSNVMASSGGASCLAPGSSHHAATTTYNYIASNCSNTAMPCKDNRSLFGSMKKGFLENITNNSPRDNSSCSSSSSSNNTTATAAAIGGGGGGVGAGISNSSGHSSSHSNNSHNSSSGSGASNNLGATGGVAAGGGGVGVGCNTKRSNETRNLSDCNSVGSKKTYNKDMPFIKPKNTDVRTSSFELHEELEHIREKQTLLNSTEWVTDALLARLQSNPNLISRLSDPTFIEAITDFQRNPQSAMAKYQGNKELQASMQEFCSILGDHLLKLDKKDGTHKPCNLSAATPLHDHPSTCGAVASHTASSSTSSPSTFVNHMSSSSSLLASASSSSSSSSTSVAASASYMDNEHKMQDLLTDPEIREALVDKKVQELIAMQNQNPERAQSMLHQGDAELRKKIRKLVDAGLLKFNS
ncbi:uncharacterized protein LOC115222230 [Argonauta hians]